MGVASVAIIGSIDSDFEGFYYRNGKNLPFMVKVYNRDFPKTKRGK